MTRSKEVFVDEAIKKQKFKVREMVVHFSIDLCIKDHMGEKRTSFLDFYEGKFKHVLQLTSSQTSGLEKCYSQSDEPLQDKELASTIGSAIQIIGNKRNFNAREKVNKL